MRKMILTFAAGASAYLALHYYVVNGHERRPLLRYLEAHMPIDPLRLIRQSLLTLLASSLFVSSITNAQEVVPVQPAPESLLQIPAWALASGIRMVTDGQLPFVNLVRGRPNSTFQFQELGKAVVVTAANADVWETAFLRRLDLYATAARARGSNEIGGVYNIRFEQTECGSLFPEGSQIEIAQDEFSFTFVLKDLLNGTGTIVEDAIVINPTSTIGQVPYWVGTTENSQIALDVPASNCHIVLTKR